MKPSARMFNAVASITTTAQGQSANGTPTRGTVSVQSSVPCRVDPGGSSETVNRGRMSGRTPARIFVPFTLDDGTAVVLRTGSEATVGGVVWRVVGEGEDQGGQGVVFAAPVERVR